MTPGLRIAALADVHGNSWALEAVLADLALRRVDRVVNLGDSLYGPLDPAGAARLLDDPGILSVMGNEDAILLEPRVDPAAHPRFRFTRDRLDAGHLAWLGRLRRTATVEGVILLCYGTSACDHEHLLEEVTAQGVERRQGSCDYPTAPATRPLFSASTRGMLLAFSKNMPYECRFETTRATRQAEKSPI